MTKEEKIAKITQELKELTWVRDNMGDQIANFGFMKNHIVWMENRLKELMEEVKQK